MCLCVFPCENIPELVERSRRVGLDGALWPTGYGSDLLDRQPHDETKHDGRALGLRELAKPGRPEIDIEGLGFVETDHVIRGEGRQAFRAGGFVAAQVQSDRPEPRPQLERPDLLFVVALEGAVGTDEGVLRDVLRVVRVMRQTYRPRIDARLIHVHECREAFVEVSDERLLYSGLFGEGHRIHTLENPAGGDSVAPDSTSRLT